MSSYLIRGLAHYCAASVMESRERRRNSYRPTPQPTPKDEDKLTDADLADWRSHMRWLIPFVQATGSKVIVDNPKSHEQIIIDQNTKELPALTLKWMQEYDKQKLLEWIDVEKKKQQKNEEERQRKLQERRRAEACGRERFGSSFVVDDKSNQIPNPSHKIKYDPSFKKRRAIFAVGIYTIILVLIAWIVYNSSLFYFERSSKDHQKYSTILSESENSPITVLVTPEGFRFDMTKKEFGALNKPRENIVLGELHYTGSQIFNPVFHEGKLCYYDFIIGKLMKNGNYHQLTNNDIDDICDYYKDFLERDYTFKTFPDLVYGRKVYVFMKANMVITLRSGGYDNSLTISCENRPVYAPIEREKIFEENKERERRSRPRFESQYPYSRIYY